MPRRKKVENLSLEEMLMKTEQEIKTTEAELKDLRLKAKELRKKIEDKQKENVLSLLKDFPKESTESIFISAKACKNFLYFPI